MWNIHKIPVANINPKELGSKGLFQHHAAMKSCLNPFSSSLHFELSARLGILRDHVSTYQKLTLAKCR